MSDKLKNAISWTIYVIITIVIVATLIILAVNIMAPTLFPEADISGFTEYINTFSIILSFASVFLGVFSIWQANSSSTQTNEILSSLSAISKEQSNTKALLYTMAASNNKLTEEYEVNNNGAWKTDTTVK